MNRFVGNVGEAYGTSSSCSFASMASAAFRRPASVEELIEEVDDSERPQKPDLLAVEGRTIGRIGHPVVVAEASVPVYIRLEVGVARAGQPLAQPRVQVNQHDASLEGAREVHREVGRVEIHAGPLGQVGRSAHTASGDEFVNILLCFVQGRVTPCGQSFTLPFVTDAVYTTDRPRSSSFQGPCVVLSGRGHRSGSAVTGRRLERQVPRVDCTNACSYSRR